MVTSTADFFMHMYVHNRNENITYHTAGNQIAAFFLTMHWSLPEVRICMR
jgi:hypothetical protein